MGPTPWFEQLPIDAFRRAVRKWYRDHGRTLPWRETSDAYGIWVSEVMLQQTTVATVLGHWERFLEMFPTVTDLAAAPLDDVLHAWQGLGYYRRARHLHQAAQIMVDQYAGQVPTDPKVLRELPGFGKYSANAVASLAGSTRCGILEANTVRLWARLSAATGDPKRPPLANQLWELAENTLPQRKVGEFNQALMDLGALICTPTDPKCPECPLRRHCQAHALGRPTDFPTASARPTITEVDHACVVIHHQSKVLLTQRPDTGQWAGLWEFPRVEKKSNESWTKAAHRAAGLWLRNPLEILGQRTSIRHSITRYRVSLRCYDAQLKKTPPAFVGSSDRAHWVRPADLLDYALSTPQRQIAKLVHDGAPVQGTMDWDE